MKPRRILVKIVSGFIAFVAMAVAPRPVSATDWISTSSGTFSNPANWAGGVVPGLGGSAHFDIGNAIYTVNFSTDPINDFAVIGDDTVSFSLFGGHNYTADHFIVGDNSGDIGGLTINGGTLFGDDATISDTAGAQGTMTLRQGALLDLVFTLNVALGGSGTFIVDGGDVNTRFAQFALTPTSVAVGSLSGAIWTMTDGTLCIGGTSSQAGGTATVTFDSTDLIQNFGGVRIWGGGNLTMLGSSTITSTDDFVIENGGELTFAGGTITMSGASATFRPLSGSFSFGQLNPSFVPTLKLIAGSDATFTTSWSIASGLNTRATMVIDGAGSSLAGVGANSDLIVGDFNGIGTLSVTNGGTVTVSDDILIGAGSSGDGTLLISGTDSTAVRANGAGSQIVIGSSGFGTFSITGGARVETTGDFVMASTATASAVGTISSNIIGDESNIVVGGGLYVGGTSAAAGGAGTLVIGQNATINVTGPTKVYPGDLLSMIGGANPSVLNTTQIDVVGGALSIGSSTPTNFNITSNLINISGGGSFTSQQYDAIADAITITDPVSSWTQTNRIAVQNSTTLRVLNGALVTSPGMNVGDTGVGTVVVDGSGSQINVNGIGALVVGSGTGNGTLTISNGGKVTKTVGASVIGLNNTTTGRVTVTGLNSLFDTFVLTIGSGAASNSTMSVLDGGRVNSTVGQISSVVSATAQPVVTVSSATANDSLWVVSDSLYVGGSAISAGGFAALNVNDGGVVDIANLMRIYGNGSVNIAGGAIDPHTVDMLPGSELTVDATGALIVSTNSTDTIRGIYVGRGSAGAIGTMTVSGGTINSDVVGAVGESDGSSGRLTLSNNAIWNNTISFRVGRTGAGTLNVLSGADLNTAATFTIGSSTNGTGTATIDGAGSSISAGTFDMSNTSTNTARLVISNGGLLTTGPANIGRAGAASVILNDNASRFTSTGAIYIGGTSTVSGGAATLQLNGGTVSAALVKIWNNGRINYSGGALTSNSIELAGGGDLVLPAGSNAHLRTTFVAIDTANGSVVDLNDNTMQITGGMSYAQVTALIASARNGGLWDGPGITSTTARNAVPKNTPLGALTGAEYKSVYGALATFSGFSVDNADVLVKYTYYGDTDFNGLVNFDDYARIDNGFNNNLLGWLNGDFDLNNAINFDDYALIDLAFNTQSGTLLRAMSYLDGSDPSERGMDAPSLHCVVAHFALFGQPYANSLLSAVPEPTSTFAFSGLAALAASRRRRK